MMRPNHHMCRPAGMKMWIRGGAAFALVTIVFMPGAEAAYRSRLKICGDSWSAAKTAGKVPAGQSWQDFYKVCSARLQEAERMRPDGAGRGTNPAPMHAVSEPPRDSIPSYGAPSPTQPMPSAAEAGAGARVPQGRSKPEAGVSSASSRQKQCAAQWRELKIAGQLPEGQKWPQFWSACNARLKAGE